MLQSEVLLEVYLSTDFSAVIDILFHEFKKSTETKKFSNFEQNLKQADQCSKLEGYCLLEQMGMTSTNFHLNQHVKPSMQTIFINKKRVDTERHFIMENYFI